MREEILSIASDLREGSMTTDEARRQLLILFDVIQCDGSCGEFDIRSATKPVCRHEFVAREYPSQPYGTCLICGETVFGQAGI